MDATKYNLRCNRNVSEKMTKKDFVYDIRPPSQNTRKLPEVGRYPVVLPLQLRRKTPEVAPYPVIGDTNWYSERGAGDAPLASQRRVLRFQCNFCQEPIATLHSLSTHVKSHLRQYCKLCYWVLADQETMQSHFAQSH